MQYWTVSHRHMVKKMDERRSRARKKTVTIQIQGNSDLPTPKTCKSGGFEKKPRKTWRFPKHELNEDKKGRTDFLFQGILYVICATYCILLLHVLKSQFLFCG